MEIIGTGNGQITKTQLKDWQKNLLLFLIPLGVIYLTSVLAVLQQPGHAFSLKDLELTQFTLGAIVLYLVNALLDLSRKFLTDNGK
jgi:hypothetical protein